MCVLHSRFRFRASVVRERESMKTTEGYGGGKTNGGAGKGSIREDLDA